MDLSEQSAIPAAEGVTKYKLDFHLAHHIDCACKQFAEMNSWRSYLYRLGLIGRDPDRYDGMSFGNVSHRLASGSTSFVISGSQTGHLPLLCCEHYALVTAAELAHNRVAAFGPVKPSSESLTHAACYQADDTIQSVLHVHSHLIWRWVSALPSGTVSCTSAEIDYGTPAMAEAVRECVSCHPEAPGVVVMLGHEDGVIAYGDSVQRAGSALLDVLIQAHHVADVAG